MRLAVLPFTLEGERSEATAGMGVEVAERLTGARSKFTVFSPREAERNQATTPDKARKAMGATHVLEVRVRVARGGAITTTASLVDLQLRQHDSAACRVPTAPGDAPILAKALVATVSGGVPSAGAERRAKKWLGSAYPVLRARHRFAEGGRGGQCGSGG